MITAFTMLAIMKMQEMKQDRMGMLLIMLFFSLGMLEDTYLILLLKTLAGI